VRLGPYEIAAPIGAGGMGEVYRARDVRLGRNVAIKVLPQSVSLDPERLRRFEMEARSASALNHPNIVTIYEVGSVDSVAYIAMELVEGSSLRAKMQGPIAVRPLLQIASQVAAGLAAAHDNGIVHRDLKPENVMVTKDGLVKILDFGVAKLTFTGVEADTHVATEAATTPGVVLGTAAYMSPEQASGHPLDFRSDQFSLGSILYEMAAGKRAFGRPTASQTQASIIEDEPQPIAAINPQVPAPLRWIIERCLSKERENRYASTKDLAQELITLRDHVHEMSGALAAEKAPLRRARGILVPALIALVIITALAVGAWRLYQHDYFWRNPLTGASFNRFTDWPGDELDGTISADGKFATFLSDREQGIFDVWVGQIGSAAFLNLTKGRNLSLANSEVRNVSFSDDTTHVAFRINSSDGKAHSVLLAPTIGGTPQPFLPNAVEAAWSPDRNHIAFYQPVPGDPIYVADRNGTNPKLICIEKPGIHQHYLTWSPDGRFIYFVRGIPSDEMDVWRVPAGGGAAERVTHHNARVRYPALLDNRTLMYVGPRSDGGSGLFTMDVERRIPHAVTFGMEEYVSVSATGDGQRMLATVANPVRDLWTAPITDHAVEESEVRRFPLPTLRAAAPRFGPDFVLYVGSKSGANSLWKIKDEEEVELWRGTEGAVPNAPAVSPDGRRISFLVRSQGRTRLHVMAADGTNVRELSDSLEARGAPSWSPDGKWVAVAATEGRANPLFKVPADGGAPVRLVGGEDSVSSNPVWSPDGRFILYSEGRGSALVRLRGVTPDGKPIPFPEIWVGNTGDRYRFLPDGKRLVINKGVLWLQNFSLLNLATGQLRDLTHLTRQFIMRSFDVSPDGKQILFDRYRENSDLVLIDLPPR
jgi:serine/threonine protein kinase